MDEVKLTKDSDYLLCSLYKAYLQKRANDVSKFAASHIGGSRKIHDDIFPNWIIEDVNTICRELSRAGMLQCVISDDEVSDSWLNDQAIIYMENRFENNVNKIIDYISKIKSMIPFI